MEIYVLIVLILTQRAYGVSVCDNVSEQGKNLSLSREYKDGTGCWCILELIGSNNDTVFVTERTAPGGCQYMLQFNTSSGFNRNYSCFTYGNFSFQLQYGKSAYIQLVAGNNISSVFIFDISFSTKSSTLSLTCNLPISTTNSPAPAPRVTTTQNALTQTYTSISVLTSTVEGHSDNDKNPNTNDGSVAAIIGGSVAGVCVIIAVVVFIIYCLVRIKAMKNTHSPATTEYVNVSTISPNITDNANIADRTNPPSNSAYVNVATISSNTTGNTYDRLNYNNNNIDQSQTGTEYTALKQ